MGDQGLVPLDFSFCNITDLTEIEKEEPREQPDKKVIREKVCQKVLLENEEEMEEEVEKYKTKSLHLSNNLICEHGSLMKVLDRIVVEPLAIGWIDMSVNELTKIDPVICEFENLSILYLHANQISDIAEVDKLRTLQKLYKLSLHCNPIANSKNYRSHVLSMVPQLKNFDMSAVTKSDRATAAAWQKSSANTSKRKKKISQEE